MKSIYSLALAFTVVLSINPRPAWSQTDKTDSPSDSQSADLAQIRAGSQAFVVAFNKRDAKAVAALWTKDGEYTDESGHTFAGREAIRKGYADFFAKQGKGEIRIMIDSLRLLSHDSAIESGRAFLHPAPAGAPGTSKYTAVHVKVDGKWLMASVRDTWVESPSAHQNLSELDWFIGTWIAEEHGNKSETVCRWVANKSFVERKYTITHVDGSKTSGVQLIGWNPQGGHVQSWNFSPEGGHAVGVWFPEQEGWSVQMRGVTGDGRATAAVNLIRRLDDRAFAWRSVQRTAGGAVLPDSNEVVVKRQPAAR